MSCNAKSIAINWTKQKVFVLFWTRFLPLKFNLNLIIRGGVEDTSLEAKDTKKPEAKAKDCPFEIRPLEAKDRNARGQGHGRRRKCSKKKIFFLSGNFRKKKIFKNIVQAICRTLTIQKIVLFSSRGQGYFRGIEALRQRPRI